MKKGCLIFAHNNRDIDYAKLALLSGALAKKNLNVPVSLVTDQSTLDWMTESKIVDAANVTFEHIIVIDRPTTDNQRVLHDGFEKKVIPFVNSSRSSAYDLSPYDKTLLIDSDFLIFSNRLTQYWDTDESVKLAPAANDIHSADRLGYHDKFISDTGIHLYWATTVMFNRDANSKLFFDLVYAIKSNYKYFADLYMFNSKQFRNDIAFSIAKHILSGFQTNTLNSLPSLLTVIDKDILYSVEGKKLTFLISSMRADSQIATAIQNTDVHIMNKQSIIRNFDNLMELA
jgi:hypothetical protein